MTLKTIGLLSPGDMGHAVGRVLQQHGLEVITCLQGRSERTRKLAAAANIRDVSNYPALVQEAELILSILVPDQAGQAAQLVAQGLRETGATLTYADCNAIAPQTVQEIGAMITAAGSRFVDASIIGPPPRQPGATRFYASGPELADFLALNDFGLNIIGLGPEIGRASALKMCYAALTKGLSALTLELLIAGEALGVLEPLLAEFQTSQQGHYKTMERLTGVPTKARRWVGEMEEIAQTFAHVGLTPQILAGAADMYRFIGQTALANRTPEDPEPPPSLAEMLSILADNLPQPKNEV
jgi:3-hydroxyisobutyrate dehydrogenase-like beta-hydroxyacid dehydrogenase